MVWLPPSLNDCELKLFKFLHWSVAGNRNSKVPGTRRMGRQKLGDLQIPGSEIISPVPFPARIAIRRKRTRHRVIGNGKGKRAREKNSVS